MSNRIIHFEIMGSDAGKSQKFYADMFGWQLGEPTPELGNYAMADSSSAGLSGGIGSEGPRWSRADDILRRRSGSSDGA